MSLPRGGTGLEAALLQEPKNLNVLISGKALRRFLFRWVAQRFARPLKKGVP